MLVRLCAKAVERSATKWMRRVLLSSIYSSRSYAVALSRPPPLPLSSMVAIRSPDAAQLTKDIPAQHGSYRLSLGPLDLSASYGLKQEGSLRLTRWTSTKSGLRVIWVDHPGPLVNGYITVATEIFNDSGVPHTLEHLIFLGSEQYPFKGVLDSLANRSFAQGTNAWTDTTNTTYTVTTAGQEGFLNLLPVYLDHCLYPTITDAGFLTEVYHINGKAEDSGVVYSEMQGRENLSSDLMELRAQRTLYEKDSGYRSETGGLMEALRKLNVQQIRDYHASHYLPHNMALIVTGQVDPKALLETLEKHVEPRIQQHQQDRGERPKDWTRPWVETPSMAKPAVSAHSELVEFPEMDESSGEWQCIWSGPDSQDFETLTALALVGTYLYDSPVSPLYKALVEIDEPYCTDIYLDMTGRSTVTLSISASSVPTEHLDSMKGRVIAVIQEEVEKNIDMERMATIIERDRLRLISAIERDTPNLLAEAAISDFLFAPVDGSHFAQSVNSAVRYQTLGAWSAEQWGDLLKKWFLDQPCLSIIGKPSAKLSETLKEDNEKRETQRKQQLGQDGLQRLDEELNRARCENDKEIPDSMLSTFPIPDAAKIEWIPVQTARPKGLSPTVKADQRDDDVQAHVAKDSTVLPYFVQFDHIPTAFVAITIYLFPRLPPNLVPLIPLWLETFFSLPIDRKDGTKLSFEEVVNELEKDAIDYSISSGQPLDESILLTIKVPVEKYEKAVEWLRDLLWHSVFDINRLRITATKLKQALPAEKREGDDVVSAAFEYWTADHSKAILLGNNLINRTETLPRLVERLSESPDLVVADLEHLRKIVGNPAGMRIAVRGDILSLDAPAATFKRAFAPVTAEKLAPIVYGVEVLSDLGLQPAKKAVIYNIPSIESSYASFICRGIHRYDHPDRPALIVAMSVMNALESFLWRNIRGAGLAYGARIRADIDGGFVYYNVYKSPDAAKAYTAAKEILLKLASKEITIDDLTLESAKSSLAYTFASQEATVGAAASSSFCNQVLYEVSRDYARDMLLKCQSTTREQIIDSIKRYILPAFEPATSIAVVASGSAKAGDISSQLNALGYESEIRTLDTSEDGQEDAEDDEESDDAEQREEDEDDSWEQVSTDQPKGV